MLYKGLEVNVPGKIFKQKEIRTIMDKRAYRVMDRIALTQLLLLFSTAILTTLLYIIGFSKLILSFWYYFLFVIPFTFITLAILKRKVTVKKQNRMIVFGSIVIIWVSITVIIGIFIDIWLGFSKTLWISLVLGIYYITGYFIARIIQYYRYYYSRKTLFFTIVISTHALIFFTLIMGYINLVYSMKINNIKSIYFEDYGKFSRCLSCAFSVFLMISGICVVISILLNWALLDALTDLSLKHNVFVEPSYKLYLRYLSGTILIILITWIFMELFIPPIPGRGGGRGGGGGGNGGGGGGNGSGSNKIINNDLEKETFLKINSDWKSLSFQTSLTEDLIKGRREIIDNINKNRKKNENKLSMNDLSYVSYKFHNKYIKFQVQPDNLDIKSNTKKDWAHIYDKYDRPINKESTPGERIKELNKIYFKKYFGGNKKDGKGF